MASNTPPSATCDLCSEVYVDPRMFQCLHSFCCMCLKKTLEEQESETSLKCPTCYMMTTLPEGGVGAIQKDIRRSHEANIVRIRGRMQSEEKKSCDFCVDTSTGPAVSFCHDCIEFLCKTCSNYHKTCRKFLNHKLEPMQSSQSKTLKVIDKPVSCQVHEDEILKFYCETCSSLICRDCMVIEHSGHTCNRLEKVVQKEKDDLLSILGSVDLGHIKVTLDKAVVKGNQVILQVERKQKSVEDLIENAFTELTNALSKRKEILLEKVSSIKMEMAIQQERFNTLRKEIVDTYDMIMTATQAYTPAEMLSVKGSMTKNLRELLKQYEEVCSETCISDMVACKLDTTLLVENIALLGLVVVGSFPEKAQTDPYVQRAVATQEKRITIKTYDVHGKRFLHGGERVKVMFSSVYQDIEGQVDDNGDGTYVASFTPQYVTFREHTDKLSITFDGQHIKGSPFDVVVRHKRDYKQLPAYHQSYPLAFQSHSYDVAVDDNGEIYIASYTCGVIEVFGGGSNQYQRRTIGMIHHTSDNTEHGCFYFPSAIAIQGNVLYVAEDKKHQVQKLTTSGEFISKFGSLRSGDGQLDQPSGLCVHTDGRVFVSDSGNNRITVYKADGTFLYHILAGNTTNYSSLWGLALSHCGDLHVVDTTTSIINVFTTEGQFITNYYCGSQVSQPSAIAIDDEGNTFVTGYRSCLCILNSQHQVIHSIEAVRCSEDTHTGITVDKYGSIYLCANKECQVY